MKEKDKVRIAKLSAEEVLVEKDYEEKTKELDRKITAVQKSTKTSIPALLRYHDKMRMRYQWYYKWHTWPYSRVAHFLILGVYILAIVLFGAHYLNAPKKAMAATTYTCTWTNGDADSVWENPNNWSGCNSTYPQNDINNIYDVVFDGTSSTDANISADVTIGSLTTTIDYSNTISGASSIYISGNLDSANGVISVNFLNFNATSLGKTVSSAASMPATFFTGIGGGWTIQSNINPSTLEVDAGTVVVSGDIYTNNYTRTGGTVDWTTHSATLSLVLLDAQELNLPADHYYNLNIGYFGTVPGGAYVYLSSGETIIEENFNVPVNIELYINDQTLNLYGSLTVDGKDAGTEDENGQVILTTGTLKIRGNITLNIGTGGTGILTAGANSTIDFSGSGAQTTTNFHSFYNFTKSGAGVLTSSGGETITGSIDIQAGIWNLGTYSITWFVAIDRTFNNSGTLQLTGTQTFFTNRNFSDSDSGTIEYTATSGSPTVKAWDYNNLIVNGGAAVNFKLSADTTIYDTLTLTSGILTAVNGGNNYNLTVKNGWSKGSGSFTPGTAAVTLSGVSAQAVTGANTFYDLTITNAAGVSFDSALSVTNTLLDNTATSTLTFKEGTTQTISNLDLLGADGAANSIILRSAAPGTAYTLTATTITNADYLDIQDATKSGALLTVAHAKDSGGNSNIYLTDSYDVTTTTLQKYSVGWSETVTGKDYYGNTVSDSTMVLTLTSSSATTKFYTNNSYGAILSSITLGSGVATLYLKDSNTAAETITYTITDSQAKTATSGQITVAGNPVNPATDTTSPSKPENFSVFNVSNYIAGTSQALLWWQPSTDAESGLKEYEVFRGNEKIATTTDYYFVDENPESGTYKVKAVDNAGNSTFSDEAVLDLTIIASSKITISDIKAQLLQLLLNNEKTSALITWKTNQPSTTLLYYGLGGAKANLTGVDNKLNFSHSVVLTNLDPGTTYHFSVASQDIYGGKTESGDQTFTTAAGPKTDSVWRKIIRSLERSLEWMQKVLAEPVLEQLGLIKSPAQISPEVTVFNVSVPAASTYQNFISYSGKTGFTLFRSTNGKNFATLAKSDKNYYFDQNLSANQTYYYQIEGVTGTVSVRTSGVDANPPVISNLATKELGQSKNRTEVLISYQTDKLSTTEVSINDKTYKDDSLNQTHLVMVDNLKPGQDYNYSVKSVDSDGVVADASGSINSPSISASKTIAQIISETLQNKYSQFVNWMQR